MTSTINKDCDYGGYLFAHTLESSNRINPNNPPNGFATGQTTVDFEGYPSQLGGNSGMIMSLCVYSDAGVIIYGMQIFLTFGSTSIATRNHPYGTNKSWSAWRVI